MKRQKYPTQRILLRSQQQKDFACIKINNAPEDAESPLEVLIREYQPKRTLDQNALMWAGPLSDIQEQVYLNGQTFSAEVWHEHFKREFLPEQFDEELCKPGYQKWMFLPNGDRILDKDNASTTKLTKKGFSQYLERIYAFGAQHGVMFGERGL